MDERKALRTETEMFASVDHRYEICTRLGLPFETMPVDLQNRTDAVQWICLHQLARRNLTASQKAVLALEVEKILKAEAKKRQATSTGGSKPQLVEFFPQAEKGKARDLAAQMMHVNPHYVTDVKKIEEHAPELLTQIKRGKLSLSQAKQVATVPKEQRAEAKERQRLSKGRGQKGSAKMRYLKSEKGKASTLSGGS